MADSVKGVVPPALSLDRTTPAGKERDKRRRGEARPKNDEAAPGATAEEAKQPEPTANADAGKTKGKIIDINA